ncbi:hypothetical protein GCM10017673_03360 [Streptosporangium violaceochromogenes]|nr:hypothetical protein GCM10017673_03360 [Streptosporangium violaceochromogenes]
MRASPQRLAVGLITLISVGYMTFPVTVLAGNGGTPGIVVLATCLPGFFVPHFLHLRAALRGAEPGGPVLGLAIQVLAAYAPFAILPGHLGVWWTGVPTILLGSVLLRLRPRAALGCLIVMTAAQFALSLRYSPGPYALGGALYSVITLIVTGFVIYGVVRLVVVSRRLAQTRMDLAEAAVLRERLRISRDLHDGLGSSLTAIALKGDLARRLVEGDPAAAGTELSELVHVARDAAQEVRQVARGYREMSLREEVHRAVALLEASGVSCQTNLADLPMSGPVDEVLAWAVREGVTNVVRHSQATTCSISTSAHAGAVRLEVVNDRARRRSGDGGGLTGLRERAVGLGGSLTAERTGGGFRLALEVPA